MLGGERPKSSDSFWPGENEGRRVERESGVGGGEFSLLAIVSECFFWGSRPVWAKTSSGSV